MLKVVTARVRTLKAMSIFKVNHQLAASVLVIMLHFRVITSSSNYECQEVNLTLTGGRGDVFYNSDAHQNCTWSFVQNLTENSVLFIYLADLKMLNSEEKCSALLRPPRRFERCRITIPCLFYQTPNSKCTMDDLYQYTKKSEYNCSQLFWDVNDPHPLNVTARTYNARFNRSFKFHYEYIRCPLDIQDLTTHSGMVKTLYPETSDSHTDTPMCSTISPSSASQNGSNDNILLVVVIAVLAVLLIATMIVAAYYYKKSKKIPTPSANDSLVNESNTREVVINQLYGQV